MTEVGNGNMLAVKHGARSPHIVGANMPAAVAELRDAMAAAIPYLQPIDNVLLERAARQLTQLRLLDEYIDRLGGSWIDAKGRPRGCWQLYNSRESQFRATLTMLGVGPQARAQLFGTLAVVSREQATAAAQERLREKHGAVQP